MDRDVRTMAVLIGPSLMCADMGLLRETTARLDSADVDFFHFDIMDGTFVPNFTMGPDMVKSLRPVTDKPFDVHLMVNQPEDHIDLFADAGADMISIHAEATLHLQGVLAKIKKRGLKAGVAVNPATPIDCLRYVLDVTDFVTIMTVNPGFAGQTFIPATYGKITDVLTMIKNSEYDIKIEVDGNIGPKTIPHVLQNGASMLVCGTSSIFKRDDSLENNVKNLRAFLDTLENKRSELEVSSQ